MKIKQCPNCGNQYDYRVQFCFQDGTELKGDSKEKILTEKNIASSSVSKQSIELGDINQDFTVGDSIFEVQGVSLDFDDIFESGEEDNEEATLDFDDFENTLDLDLEDLEKMEQETVGVPLQGSGIAVLPQLEPESNKEELLPGDTLDLVLDLDVLEGLDELKEEQKKKEEAREKELAARREREKNEKMEDQESGAVKDHSSSTNESAPIETLKTKENTGTSKIFLGAVIVGVIAAIIGFQFLGSNDNTEQVSQQKISDKKEAQIKKQISVPKAEKEQITPSVEEVKEEPAENDVKNDVENMAEKEAIGTAPSEKIDENSIDSVKNEAENKPETKKVEQQPEEIKEPMKLPTEPVPDKKKIIPTPIPVTPKKVEKTESTTTTTKKDPVKDPVVVNDGSVALWGAPAAVKCNITVNANASAGKVFLDGKEVGAVGKAIPVDCTSYQLKVEAKGYLPMNERKITLSSDKTFTVELKQ